MFARSHVLTLTPWAARSLREMAPRLQEDAYRQMLLGVIAEAAYCESCGLTAGDLITLSSQHGGLGVQCCPRVRVVKSCATGFVGKAVFMSPWMIQLENVFE